MRNGEGAYLSVRLTQSDASNPPLVVTQQLTEEINSLSEMREKSRILSEQCAQCYNPESVGSQAPGPDVCTRSLGDGQTYLVRDDSMS